MPPTTTNAVSASLLSQLGFDASHAQEVYLPLSMKLGSSSHTMGFSWIVSHSLRHNDVELGVHDRVAFFHAQLPWPLPVSDCDFGGSQSGTSIVGQVLDHNSLRYISALSQAYSTSAGSFSGERCSSTTQMEVDNPVCRDASPCESVNTSHSHRPYVSPPCPNFDPPMFASQSAPPNAIPVTHSHLNVYSRSPSPSDISGCSRIRMWLYGNKLSGINASPFLLDHNGLLTLCSQHGLACTSELSCRKLLQSLITHLCAGQCVDVPRPSSALACPYFSVGYHTASALASDAFYLLSDARSSDMSVGRLRVVIECLDLEFDSHGANFRRRAKQLFRRCRSSITETGSSVSSSIQSLLPKDVLRKLDVIGVDELDPLLLSHGYDPYEVNVLASVESKREVLLQHLVSADCFDGLEDIVHSGCTSFKSFVSTASRVKQSAFLRSRSLDYPKQCFVIRLYSCLRQFLKGCMLPNALCSMGDDIDTLRHSTYDHMIKRMTSHIDARISCLRSIPEYSTARSTSVDASHDRVAPTAVWPPSVSDEQKDSCVRNFRQATSTNTLSTSCCASCGRRILDANISSRYLDDLPLQCLASPRHRVQANSDDVADDNYPDLRVKCQRFFPSLLAPTSMLHPDGLYTAADGKMSANLCRDCLGSLSRQCVPRHSLANHNFVGDVPDVLKNLSVVEEAMISRCRAKVTVVQLTESGVRKGLQFVQKGMKGNIIVYPQDVTEIAKSLPPSLEELKKPMCIMFVGSTKPTDSWIRERAKPLLIRPLLVRSALQWLKRNNTSYADVDIDLSTLSSLPEVSYLSVPIYRYDGSAAVADLTSRYDNVHPEQNESATSIDPIEFERVCVPDVPVVDISSPQALRASAAEHLKRGGPYTTIGHMKVPCNEFKDPSLLPYVYPTLFPFALGGFEHPDRSVPFAMDKQLQYFMDLQDSRFQTHTSFMFVVFNMLQRRKVLLNTHKKVQYSSFQEFARKFSAVPSSEIEAYGAKVNSNPNYEPQGEHEILISRLLREMRVVQSSVAGSPGMKLRMKNDIRSMILCKGNPTFFITINPADVYSPVFRVINGENFDLDNMLGHDVKDYISQAADVARNPVQASKFFNTYMDAFFRHILNYLPGSIDQSPGVFGTTSAYYGCIEAQGRGSLHCHMVVWLDGSVNPDVLRNKLLNDETFQSSFISYLESVIKTETPPNPLPHVDNIFSTQHPSKLRGPPVANDENSLRCRQQDMHFLVESSQRHRHSNTCYKHWEGIGYDKTCRFNLDAQNIVPESTVDIETGEIELHKLDGLVNNYSPSVLEALRCNMDIKFLGSGAASKAVLYYITDYITKSALNAHVAFSALEIAVTRLGPFDPGTRDLATYSKQMINKCAFAMLGRQELSSQEVANFISGCQGSRSSHTFHRFFIRDLNHILPSSNVDDNTQVENSFEASFECEVETDDSGTISKKVSVFEDYLHRPSLLQDLCLWDFMCRYEKYRCRTLPDDDDVDVSRQSSRSSSKKSYSFTSSHPQSRSHKVKLLPLGSYHLPSPVGSPLPRRDRDDCHAFYCYVMLSLFQPWSCTSILHAWKTGTSESEFDRLRDTWSPSVHGIMNNAQLLHECRDSSRDDKYARRRDVLRQNLRDAQATNGHTTTAVDDDISLEELQQELVFEHLSSMADCRSNYLAQRDDDCDDVLNSLRSAGVFVCTGLQEFPDPIATCKASDDSLECAWTDYYSQRRKDARTAGVQMPVDDVPHFDQYAAAFDANMETIPQRFAAAVQQVHSGVSTGQVANSQQCFEFASEIALCNNFQGAQMRAFMIVVNSHISNLANTQPHSLRMYIAGPGGSGKSSIIHAVTDYFSRVGHQNQIRMCSFTGVASKNVNGSTLHSALNLNRNMNKVGTREDLKSRWEGVNYLVIDEVSMIGCHLLARIGRALCIAKGNAKPFGGINIIFAGDFAQLSPVGDMPLFSNVTTDNVTTPRKQDTVLGKLLWLSVTMVVQLSVVYRQHGHEQERFSQLLQRLRYGRCNIDDFELLKSRTISCLPPASIPDEYSTTALVPRNDTRDAINEQATQAFARHTGRALHWYYASDMAGKSCISIDSPTHGLLKNLHGSACGYRLTKIPLVIGMPVMLISNLDVVGGATNGTTGFLKSIRYYTDAEGYRHLLSCVISTTQATDVTPPGLEAGDIAIVCDTQTFRLKHLFSGKGLTISRTQVPIAPAFCLTVHKAQGCTLNSALVDLHGCRGTAQPYVMLSRVKTLENLFILRDFDIKAIQCRVTEDLRHEFDRLDMLNQVTEHAYLASNLSSGSITAYLDNDPYEEDFRGILFDQASQDIGHRSKADVLSNLQNRQSNNNGTTRANSNEPRSSQDCTAQLPDNWRPPKKRKLNTGASSAT